MMETSKLVKYRSDKGLYDTVFVGRGLEIGGWRDPLQSPRADITDHTLPNGSTHILPYKDGEFDFLYASHVLEHFDTPEAVLAEWTRVVKSGGYVYIAVPHFEMYEKSTIPSKFNAAHKSFFLPATPDRIRYRTINNDTWIDIMVDYVDVVAQDYDYTASDDIDQTRGSASAQIDFAIKVDR